jgi:hypothetical protein
MHGLVGRGSSDDEVAAPNSAGAERAFSLLNFLFGNNQETALADYICGSMMLRYNSTERAREARK